MHCGCVLDGGAGRAPGSRSRPPSHTSPGLACLPGWCRGRGVGGGGPGCPTKWLARAQPGPAPGTAFHCLFPTAGSPGLQYQRHSPHKRGRPPSHTPHSPHPHLSVLPPRGHARHEWNEHILLRATPPPRPAAVHRQGHVNTALRLDDRGLVFLILFSSRRGTGTGTRRGPPWQVDARCNPPDPRRDGN